MAKLVITIEDTKSASGKGDITMRIESEPGFPGPAAADQTLTPAQELALSVMEVARRSAPKWDFAEVIQRLREGEARIAEAREQVAKEMQKHCKPLFFVATTHVQPGADRNGDIYPPAMVRKAYEEYAECLSRRGEIPPGVRRASQLTLQQSLREMADCLLPKLLTVGPLLLREARPGIERILSEACVSLAPDLNWITTPQEPPEGWPYGESSPTDGRRHTLRTCLYTVDPRQADAVEQLSGCLSQMPAGMVSEARVHSPVAVERPQLSLEIRRGKLEFYAWMDYWCPPRPTPHTPTPNKEPA